MHFKPKRVKIQRVFCLGLLLVAFAVGAEVSLSEVYESDDGSLMFRYPAGWFVNDAGIMGAHGRTALMLAAGRGHTEIVQLLIDAEADVNAKTTQGDWTVLKIAEYERHSEIV